ncbi:MAG: hypothetical protein ACYDB1_05135 [Acidiferrobacteraceae bacterium]
MTGSRLARVVLAVVLWLAPFAFPVAHAGPRADSAGRPCPATRWLRSVWMWHYRQVLRHPRRVVRVLERHGIDRVYLQIARPLSAFRPFLGRAHEAGIQVFALEGSPDAVLDPAPILRHTAELARFNVRPGPRFQGLQLDIEPYALKRFWKHQRRYLSRYLGLLSKVRQAAPPGFWLSVAIPSWFSRLRFDEHSMSALAVGLADEIVIMSYRGGMGSAERAAAPAVRQARVAHKPAYIGIRPEQQRSSGARARTELTLASGYVLESYSGLNQVAWHPTAQDVPRLCSTGQRG